MGDDPKKIVSCKGWTLPEIDPSETLDHNSRMIAEWAINYTISELYLEIHDGKVKVWLYDDFLLASIPIEDFGDREAMIDDESKIQFLSVTDYLK